MSNKNNNNNNNNNGGGGNNEDVEIRFGKQVHVVRGHCPTYSEVLSAARVAFYIEVDAVSYEDDEGDRVTVKSDTELTEAYRLSHVIFVEGKPIDKNIELDSGFRDVSPPPVDSYFDSTKEDEAFSSIEHQLKDLTATVTELYNIRKNHLEQMRIDAHYKKIISDLENQIQQYIKQVDNETQRKKELITENEKLHNELQDKIDQIKRTNKQVADLNNDLFNAREVSSRLGNHNKAKFKEILELKAKLDEKLILEEKVQQLQRELESKSGDNLHMSRQLVDFRAEKDVYFKKVQTLEQLLQKEQEEKETLQQSISIQSSRMDFLPNLSEPFPVHYSDHSKFEAEINALSSHGYVDVKKNIELLTKHDNDISKVVGELPHPVINKQSDVSSAPRVLPEGISEVDLQVLESMGFHDFHRNVSLLKQHEMSNVIEILLREDQ